MLYFLYISLAIEAHTTRKAVWASVHLTKVYMRETKFRGWVKDANLGKGSWDYATPDDSHWEQFWFITEPETRGQYTGLLDKNGKEIYEGDVVRGQYTHYDPCRDDHVKDEKMGGVVYWDLYQWSFKVVEHLCDQDREGKCNYFSYMDEKDYWAPQVFEDMQVIGNIYENPELSP